MRESGGISGMMKFFRFQTQKVDSAISAGLAAKAKTAPREWLGAVLSSWNCNSGCAAQVSTAPATFRSARIYAI
jgi:hypothetical protein